jgi:hypothetical protein
MPKIFIDQDYLRIQQYRQGNNLDTRIQHHEHFSNNPRLFEGLA